ncbi:MAG: hypothetical protein ACM3S1_13590 [Hyphomicrobiales bacterium]
MTATPETTSTTDTQHHFLTGLAQQGRYAHEFARAGKTQEALEHCAAIERLTTAYRLAIGAEQPKAIHRHFGLSYANYLVLSRTLLQSMPDQWQARFVALLDEMHDAFQHVPQAEAYEVTAGTEHIVNEMTPDQLEEAGITEDEYDEPVPEDLSPFDLAEWREEHAKDVSTYYDRDGNEVDPDSYVLIPCADPVPHYNRGRARIEPRLGGGQ